MPTGVLFYVTVKPVDVLVAIKIVSLFRQIWQKVLYKHIRHPAFNDYACQLLKGKKDRHLSDLQNTITDLSQHNIPS